MGELLIQHCCQSLPNLHLCDCVQMCVQKLPSCFDYSSHDEYCLIIASRKNVKASPTICHMLSLALRNLLGKFAVPACLIIMSIIHLMERKIKQKVSALSLFACEGTQVSILPFFTWFLAYCDYCSELLKRIKCTMPPDDKAI